MIGGTDGLSSDDGRKEGLGSHWGDELDMWIDAAVNRHGIRKRTGV